MFVYLHCAFHWQTLKVLICVVNFRVPKDYILSSSLKEESSHTLCNMFRRRESVDKGANKTE